MATSVNNIELRDVLSQLITKHGGVRPAARVLRVSAPYLSRLARGEKIWPSDTLLKKLRMSRQVIYLRHRDGAVSESDE